MLLNPGKEFDFNGTKAKYPDVKMAYWVGGNPFVHHQDRNRMVAAWKKLETFIVQDFQWTPTARFADIVLPATTSYERNDIDSVGDYAAIGDPGDEEGRSIRCSRAATTTTFSLRSRAPRQGKGVHRRQDARWIGSSRSTTPR